LSNTLQFGSKPIHNIPTSSKTNSETAQTVPEDITAFFNKIDKDDEDEEEDQQFKTVSFEVNQARLRYIYIYLIHLYKML